VDVLREQLLDAYGVRAAILHPVLEVLRSVQYGDLGAALARAVNEWTAQEWLAADERLVGAISVPLEDGARAAAEIERVAADQRWVKVTLTIMTREPLGHPNYWPIYEAAVAHGLPVALHVGGFSGTHSACGWATYFVEHHTLYTQSYVAQVINLVASGVFKRFPGLRIVLEEGGLAWMPALMWRLDRAWEQMCEEVPELDEPPSAVIRRHFAFTTQPLDEPTESRQLADVLDTLDMDDAIVFASDYPHWDFDDPRRSLPSVAIHARRREAILRGNAMNIFPRLAAC
jgi:predicted TIM-barrel fold metal-dependent hydrolase